MNIKIRATEIISVSMIIGTIIALVLSVIFAFLLYSLLKRIVPLIINGLIGIATFWVLNILGITHVNIDLWTFLIAAIGGIFGVLIVIVLSFIGIQV